MSWWPSTGNSTLDMIIVFILAVAPVCVILAIVFTVIRVGEVRAQQLLTEGEAATATVIDAHYTGVRVNGSPQIAIDLEVRRMTYPPYKVTVRQLIKRSRSIFQTPVIYPPGTVLNVKVDQTNPKRLAIVGPAAGTESFGADGTGAFGADGATFSRAFSHQAMNASAFFVNGKAYTNAEELPAEARAALEKASALLGDANGDGMPDIFQAGAGASSGGAAARLAELKQMLDQGLINQTEYETKKAEIISRM